MSIFDLVVVSVCDGIGVHTSLFHLKQDSHSHDRKSPQATELHHHTVAHLVGTNLPSPLTNHLLYKQIQTQGTSTAPYLIQNLHLVAPHYQQDVVCLVHGATLGLSQSHSCWQADEPQAVAVAEQAAGPQLRVGVEPLGHLVCQLYLLLVPFFSI